MMRLEDFIESVPAKICCRCKRECGPKENWSYICLSCRKELKMHSEAQEARYLVWHVIRKYGRKSFGRKK